MKKFIQTMFVLLMILGLFTSASTKGRSEAKLGDRTIVNAVQWSPSGNWLAVGYEDEVKIFDPSLTVVSTLPTESVRTMRWSPDGTTLAIGNFSDTGGVMTLWNVSTNTVINEFSANGTEDAIPMAWSLDGTLLAVVGERIAIDRTAINVIDLSTFQVIKTLIGHSLGVNDLAWSPDGAFLASAGGYGRGLFLWDLSTDQPKFSFNKRDVMSVAWNADGTLFASAGGGSNITVWSTATGQEVTTLIGDDMRISQLDWQGDSLASAASAGKINMWDTPTGTLTGTIDVGSFIFGIDWHPNEKIFTYGGVSGELNSVTFPTSYAGPDQTLTDTNGNGSELVTLDGTGSSDPDGTIVSYEWQENGVTIATGPNPQVELAVGVHNIILRVTDNDGLADLDEVVITIEGGSTASCDISVPATDTAGLIAAINTANANPDPNTLCLAENGTYTLTFNSQFGCSI